MARPAETEDNRDFAGSGAAVTLRVECRDAGAHQRRRLDGG